MVAILCNIYSNIFPLYVFQGMLALEGELTPILVQMVKSAHTNGLLDHEKEDSGSILGRYVV